MVITNINLFKIHSFKYIQDTILFFYFMELIIILSVFEINGLLNFDFFIKNIFVFFILLIFLVFNNCANKFFKKAKQLILYQLISFVFLLLHILIFGGAVVYYFLGSLTVKLYSMLIIYICYCTYRLINTDVSKYFKNTIEYKIIDNAQYSFHAFHPMSKKNINLYNRIFNIFMFLFLCFVFIGVAIVIYLLWESGINYETWNSYKVLTNILMMFPLFLFLGVSYKGTLFSICDLMAVLEQEKIIGQPVMVKALKKESKNNVS